MSTVLFAPGGYHYVPSMFQYSAGVLAAPGFDLEFEMDCRGIAREQVL